MGYPIEYWTKYLRYWWGTFGLLCMIAAMIVVAEVRGDWLFEICMATFLLLVVYRRVLCVTIPPYSMVVRSGVVQELCLEKEQLMIWNSRVRAARIVEVPHEGFLDREFRASIVVPAQGFRLCVCVITVSFCHIMQRNAWQRFYETFAVRGAAGTTCMEILVTHTIGSTKRLPIDATADAKLVRGHIVPPIVTAFNRELKPYGIRVRSVDCSVAFPTIFTVPHFSVPSEA